LAVSNSVEERPPFFLGETELWPFGVLAVANVDFVIGQPCHLDAVAVSEAQRAVDPSAIQKGSGLSGNRI
jgi:hypothetical protein